MKELVENMIIAFPPRLGHDPGFLEEVVATGRPGHLARARSVREVKPELGKFPKSTRIIITNGFGISKTFQEWIRTQDLVDTRDLI